MSFLTMPFLQAVQDVSAGNKRVPRSELLEKGSIPVVDQGQTEIAGFTNDHDAIVKSEPPVIVFGDHTRAFKFVNFPFAAGADGVKLLKAGKEFDPKYVYHYLRSRPIPSAGYSRHFKFLKELTIPKPPLPEQRRIAAILDHADALRTKRQRSAQETELLRWSMFRHLVGTDASRSVTSAPRLESSRGWQWVPLKSLATLATGHTPDRKQPGYWDGDIPWVSLPEIRALDGRVATDTSLKITQAGLDNSSAVLLPTGTVCFSRTASIGFVTQLGRPMATSQDFHNWIPGSELNATLPYERIALLAIASVR